MEKTKSKIALEIKLELYVPQGTIDWFHWQQYYKNGLGVTQLAILELIHLALHGFWDPFIDS